MYRLPPRQALQPTLRISRRTRMPGCHILLEQVPVERNHQPQLQTLEIPRQPSMQVPRLATLCTRYYTRQGEGGTDAYHYPQGQRSDRHRRHHRHHHLETKHGSTKVGIEAPKEVSITRQELTALPGD
jgi:hypothetical protein